MSFSYAMMVVLHSFCTKSDIKCRNFTGLLTKKFINLLKQAEDGILDLNKAAGTLEVMI